MHPPESTGDKLVSLNALRGDLSSPAARQRLQQALDDRSNRVVERAADLIAEAEDKALVEQLLQTYHRLQSDAVKADPGCLAKTAIMRALVRLDYSEAELFRAGVHYRQYEPIWGGEKDTAAELRSLCAIGLAGCAEVVEVLNCCAVLLADPVFEARAGAARALGALSQPEGAALLRLKLLTGDKVPDVIGECCSALLKLERTAAVPFVVELLASNSADTCVQAGLALGESRLAEAFEPLRSAWARSTDRTVRESLLLCIGLLCSPAGSDFFAQADRRERSGLSRWRGQSPQNLPGHCESEAAGPISGGSRRGCQTEAAVSRRVA